MPDQPTAEAARRDLIRRLADAKAKREPQPHELKVRIKLATTAALEAWVAALPCRVAQ